MNHANFRRGHELGNTSVVPSILAAASALVAGGLLLSSAARADDGPTPKPTTLHQARLVNVSCCPADDESNHRGHDYFVMGSATVAIQGKRQHLLILGGRLTYKELNERVHRSCEALARARRAGLRVDLEVEASWVGEGEMNLKEALIRGKRRTFDPYKDFEG